MLLCVLRTCWKSNKTGLLLLHFSTNATSTNFRFMRNLLLFCIHLNLIQWMFGHSTSSKYAFLFTSQNVYFCLLLINRAAFTATESEMLIIQRISYKPHTPEKMGLQSAQKLLFGGPLWPDLDTCVPRTDSVSVNI